MKKKGEHVLLAKVASTKPISRNTLMFVISKAWKFVGGWKAIELKPGLFKLRFNSQIDREALLKRRLWTVKGAQLLLEEWPEDLALEEVEFLTCPFWVSVAGLPPDLIHTQSIKRFAAFFGEVLECKASSKDRFKSSIRFKVKASIVKPLYPGFFLERENQRTLWIQAKYENLGSFCYKCGILGHEQKECTRRKDIMAVKPGFKVVPMYGPWLEAKSEITTCFTDGGRPCSTTAQPCPEEKNPDDPSF